MGQPITVTQIINNPTLIPGSGHGGASAFFQNKAAVTGVFVVVGLAATAVVFFVAFCFRRKRKNRLRDHDTAVAATMAELGFRRQALIDAGDDHPVNDPRNATTPTGSGSSAYSMTVGGPNQRPVSDVYSRQTYNQHYPSDSYGGQTYNPYTDNQALYPSVDQGPSNPSGIPNFSLPSVPGVGLPLFGHGPKDSMGSSEPLLGPFSENEFSRQSFVPTIPPRNPLRSMGGAADARHDLGGRDGDPSAGYRDDDDSEFDVTRKCSLKVRNNPD